MFAIRFQPSVRFDFSTTVIKVSQAVSGEIVFGKLIDTLMRTAIEHAGAERGLLILRRGVAQRIEAEAVISGDSIRVSLREASTVTDSGIGLKAEDLPRLFEPFYTTKAEGMSMGLAISRSIMEAHGGRLWATLNTDVGATFQFMLPAQGR